MDRDPHDRAASNAGSTAVPPARPGYEVAFHDDFASRSLDRARWLPHYLPQWSSRAAGAARYDLTGSSLRLRIDEDQEPWCPDVDGNVRVSSLQTGCYAGPLGSTIGQHRFDPRLEVREEQPELRLYTPTYGTIETRLRAIPVAGYMVALWLIGFEARPEESAEICVCEIFGHTMDGSGAEVGFGLHPFHDPRIEDEFIQRRFPIDATAYHTYAVDWTPEGVAFFLDGECIHRSSQSPGYPMQLMLGVYELPDLLDGGVRRGPWPKVFEVDWVRGYRRA